MYISTKIKPGEAVTVSDRRTAIGEFAKIYANYQLGGYNNFSGKEEQRGIYISFQISNLEEHSERTMLMGEGSYKIFFKALSRKSVKALDQADEFLFAKKDKIFEFYMNGEKDKLISLIRSAYLSGRAA